MTPADQRLFTIERLRCADGGGVLFDVVLFGGVVKVECHVSQREGRYCGFGTTVFDPALERAILQNLEQRLSSLQQLEQSLNFVVREQTNNG